MTASVSTSHFAGRRFSAGAFLAGFGDPALQSEVAKRLGSARRAGAYSLKSTGVAAGRSCLSFQAWRMAATTGPA